MYRLVFIRRFTGCRFYWTPDATLAYTKTSSVPVSVGMTVRLSGRYFQVTKVVYDVDMDSVFIFFPVELVKRSQQFDVIGRLLNDGWKAAANGPNP